MTAPAEPVVPYDSAERLSTFLRSCGERRRVELCGQILDWRRAAIHCDTDNHAGALAELHSMRLTMSEAVAAIGAEVSPDEAIAARLVKAMLDAETRPDPVSADAAGW